VIEFFREHEIELFRALVMGAIFMALVGIVVRDRARYCWSFTAFLAAVFTGEMLVIAWPDVFFTPKAWMIRQFIYSVLKMTIAVQLAAIVFAAFPGAKARARRVLFLMLIVTASMMVGMPAALSYQGVAVEWMPRVLSGTIWLMTGIAILVVYYRIPLDPFHKAILTGFVPYNLICVSLGDLMHRYGFIEFIPYFNMVQPPAYFLLFAYWAKQTWRRDEVPEAVSPALLQALHPWRARARA
jgi:hypothetical protein